MKRSLFLFIVALASFAFGDVMFFFPGTGANLLGISAIPETLSVLRGLGGLIIGSGFINYYLRKQEGYDVVRGLLLANIFTHLLGLSADVWGIADGALTIAKMAPVECTHLFVGIGSLIYFMRLQASPKQ